MKFFFREHPVLRRTINNPRQSRGKIMFEKVTFKLFEVKARNF